MLLATHFNLHLPETEKGPAAAENTSMGAGGERNTRQPANRPNAAPPLVSHLQGHA